MHHRVHHTLLKDFCSSSAFSHLPQELVCLMLMLNACYMQEKLLGRPGHQGQDLDPWITTIFPVRTCHYFPVFPPSPKRGVSGRLFTKIYYSMGGVQAWSQGRRGREPSSWRTRRTKLPALCGPSKDIYILSGIPGTKAQTKRNATSSLCQSNLQAPSRNGTIGEDFQNVEAVEKNV